MQGTQYATKRSILCRGAFCGPTVRVTLTNSSVTLLGYTSSVPKTLKHFVFHARRFFLALKRKIIMMDKKIKSNLSLKNL